MKGSKVLLVVVVLAMLAALIGCAAPAPAPAPAAAPAGGDQPAPTAAPAEQAKKTYKDLVVGYAQLGAESEWRTANTESVKEAAARLGVELGVSDAQQKQENQISAIRALIAQKVDVIGVAPLVEAGWDDVFKEAKEAGIPIILVDRRADVLPDLYVTLMGSDFLEEGRKAARIMATLTDAKANIVELQGTRGSAPANDRFAGLPEVLKDYPDIKVIDYGRRQLYGSQGQRSDASLPEDPWHRHHRGVRTQRRHGVGRNPGDRRIRPEARRGYQDRVN